MTEQNVSATPGGLRHSILGILSIIFSLSTFLVIFANVFFSLTILGVLSLIFPFVSLTLSIIDITKKNRKKILSIISLIISGVLVMIILAMMFILYSLPS